MSNSETRPRRSVDFERVRAFFADLPHSEYLGIEAIDNDDGVALARLDYQPAHVGNPATGVLHSGIVTTLIDQTGGAAVAGLLQYSEMVATLDLRVDHLRAAQPGLALYVRSECYRLTTHIGFVRSEAYHEECPEAPVAMGVASYMRTPARA